VPPYPTTQNGRERVGEWVSASEREREREKEREREGEIERYRG
jgi:hypothetical protein